MKQLDISNKTLRELAYIEWMNENNPITLW